MADGAVARGAPSARDQRGRDLLLDGGLALLACSVLVAVDVAIFQRLTIVEAGTAVLCLAALTVRRRWPGPVFAAVALVLLVESVTVCEMRAVDAVFVLAVYSACCWAGTGWRVGAVAAGVLGAGWGAVMPPRLPARSALQSLAVTAAFYLVVVAAAAALGLWSLTHRRLAEEYRLRAERAEVEQEQRALLIASRDRARIARDVHDVVAHSLTVIAVQAQAGSFAAGTRPEAAVAALDAIATTAKAALGDVREVLHLLRASDPPEAVTVAVDDLIGQARALGLRAEVTQTGHPRPVSSPVADTAYRVVQEALTNTLKYAGPSSAVSVHLGWAADRFFLRVENDRAAWASGQPPAPGAGLGLRGMRERLQAIGGTLDAGPTDGGFVVCANLPYQMGAR